MANGFPLNIGGTSAGAPGAGLVRAAALAALMVATGSCGALGQLVAPIGQKPAATPEYVPPGGVPSAPVPIATPAAAPADPELPPIDIVKRDSNGKLLPPDGPIVEVALLASMGDLKTDEAREKARKAIEDRRALVEQAVAQHAKQVIEARGKLAKLDSITGSGELSGISTLLRGAQPSPTLIDLLRTAGFSAAELARLRKANEDYTKAMTQEAKADAGGDSFRMVEPLLRSNLRLSALEPLRAAEGMLLSLGDRWEAVRDTLSLTPAQRAAIAESERSIASSMGQTRADAVAEALSRLDEQQQNAALAAVARPLPEGLPPPSTTPARPARPVTPTPGSAAPKAPTPGKKPV